ncbi:aminopeptidase P family protein [Eubacterium xylanophilum]|uniref:aminopeptidase P family protein n=1 Tax=Eubacterium xylanophilum TaxID=39497 RepID=UPI00047EB4A4|nr:aminopeptidase P family protein [Eubacterium xylanophilum]
MIIDIEELIKKPEDADASELRYMLIASSPANMRKISGFTGEGLVCLMENERFIVTDSRYTIAAKNEIKDFEVYEMSGGYMRTVLKIAAQKSGILSEGTKIIIGFEDTKMTMSSFNQMKMLSLINFPKCNISFRPLEAKLDAFRRVKTVEEIEIITRAEKIGDMAFDKIMEYFKKSRASGKKITEREISARIEFYMKELGADKTSFDTIVASGLHSAMPHAVPTDKVIEDGDFVTMDFGCMVEGYCSDMTRTIVYGRASDKQKKIYNLVLRAQQHAIDNLHAGMTGSEIDELARKIIRDEGYGDYFGHSLGHSVGLEIHENPNFSVNCNDIIEPDMVITVEPGIYIENFGGVRIEDVVVVKEDGCVDITESSKGLIEIV